MAKFSSFRTWVFNIADMAMMTGMEIVFPDMYTSKKETGVP
ncbi:hypothetical protein B0O44_103140 [Pedobacter nutrimenti]|uniref:Uncharacterized protein n=1 Tax=Pedobacter nutrimenti TaxID=1241337 RepID=A0A318UE72_9SPHI|nr:hypothetical protein B0O44_103140 [Pedobacter nutrimenti]